MHQSVMHLNCCASLFPRCRREGHPAVRGAETKGGHRQSSHPQPPRSHPGRGHQRPWCRERTHCKCLVKSTFVNPEIWCADVSEPSLCSTLRFSRLWTPSYGSTRCWWSLIGWARWRRRTTSSWSTGAVWPNKGPTVSWWPPEGSTTNWCRGRSWASRRGRRSSTRPKTSVGSPTEDGGGAERAAAAVPANQSSTLATEKWSRVCGDVIGLLDAFKGL